LSEEKMWAAIRLGLSAAPKDDMIPFFPILFDADSSTQARRELLNNLKEFIAARQKEERAAEIREQVAQINQEYFSSDCKIPIGQVQCLRPVDSDRHIFIYDSRTDSTHTYTPAALDQVINRYPKEARDNWKQEHMRGVKIKYHPRMDRFFEEDNHTVFNPYNPPDWRKTWKPDYSNSTMPEEVEFILNHLAKSQEDRKLLLCWLRDVVFSSPEQILILRGDEGCGKNLYGEHIAGALVGNSGNAKNFYKAQRKFGESSFHGHMANCQIFFMDEFKLDYDLRQTLKDYHNGSASLETKFETVTAPKELHCGFIITANRKSNIQLDYGDRKFYVPELNTVDLKLVKPREWIDRFTEVLLKNNEYLVRIANYLHFHVETLPFPEKTPAFMELCWLAVTRRCFDEKEFRRIGAKGMRVEFETLRENLGAFGRARGAGDKGVGEFQISETSWTFISHIYGREDLIHRDKNVTHLTLIPEVAVEATSLGAN
jgi:hypothetical protein